jgi:hypothetical protein
MYVFRVLYEQYAYLRIHCQEQMDRVGELAQLMKGEKGKGKEGAMKVHSKVR